MEVLKSFNDFPSQGEQAVTHSPLVVVCVSSVLMSCKGSHSSVLLSGTQRGLGEGEEPMGKVTGSHSDGGKLSVRVDC